MAGRGSYSDEDSALHVQSLWARRWIGTFLATALLLVAAAAVEIPILAWMAAAACVVLGLVTLMIFAVSAASERPFEARKGAALHTVRWLCAAAAALVGALVVEATVSSAVGAVLAALALLALFGAFAALFLR